MSVAEGVCEAMPGGEEDRVEGEEGGRAEAIAPREFEGLMDAWKTCTT